MNTELTGKALETAIAGMARYSEINVGDQVTAPLRDGSKFINARVYAITETSVTFITLNYQVKWEVDMETAAACTVLDKKFDRAAVIAEILSYVA